MTKAPNRTRPHKARSSQELKRERVYYVAGLMARGEWAAERAQKLAEQWKLAVGSVQDYAAEASRLCQWSSTEIEQIETWARMRLQEIATQDRRDRVPALQTLLASIGRLHSKPANPDATPVDADPDMVVQRAVRSMLRDPQSRKIMVEVMQVHAPEMLAPGLRMVETTGEEHVPALPAKGDGDG